MFATNSLVMFVEDFGGESLKILMQQRQWQLTLEEFLEMAINITETLGCIHNKNIIHKDINPSNIVLNSETKELKIIDFGISTKLKKETPIFKNPNILEGTLAYISPEQTGRMNRSLDYRTDFYSLGVTYLVGINIESGYTVYVYNFIHTSNLKSPHLPISPSPHTPHTSHTPNYTISVQPDLI